MINEIVTLNVKDYGALGDGKTDNTPMIQNVIDKCSQNGGGKVHIPSGQYLCGTIQFRSNVTLYLENGAFLVSATDPELFNDGGKMRRWRLIIADNLENIAICGQGKIVGTGQEELQRRAGTTYDMASRPAFRPGVIHFRNCRNVIIRDITFQHSDNWTVCLDQCKSVLIDGVRIDNNYFRTNSDGIDIVSCERVRISNCDIIAGDDGIVIKTLEKIPCRDVVVTNCIVESCATGLKIGTESYGDFSDILFTNCIVKNSYGGAGIFIKDGATAERIKFSHCLFSTYDDPYSINLSNSVCPIFLDVEKRNEDSKLGQIRDVFFEDISIRSENSIVIQSHQSNPIENLSLKGLFFDVSKDFDFSIRQKPAGTIHAYNVDAGTEFVRKESYIVLANINTLFVDDIYVRINPEVFEKTLRNAIHGHKLHNGTIRSIRMQPFDSGIPALNLIQSSGINVIEK